MLRTSFLCLLSGLTFCASAVAERTCRILFIGGGADAPKSLILFDGKGAQEVVLPSLNLSPVYKLPPGEINLHLFETLPENLEEIPEGTPKAKVGEKIADIYLLVASDPNNKTLSVSMRVINADQGSFRKGQLMWFNLTKSRIGGNLGTEKLALEPNSRKISNSPANGAEAYPVNLFYQLPGEKDVWPLSQTKWQHNPEGRIVMFVLNENGSKIPQVVGFPDFRFEEEKKEENL